jgi:ABC-type transport system involved in multi-copper enzyme maturation permease subunit
VSGYSIFLRYIRNETVANLKGSDFIGFLGLIILVMPFIFTISWRSSNPFQNETAYMFNMAGLIGSVFFAYLVTQKFTKDFEKRTINILLTSPLSRTKILLGKLLSEIFLIPVFLGVLGIIIGILAWKDGEIPQVEVGLILYQLLILGLFLISIILFSMTLSIWLSKSGSVLTLSTLYIFLPYIFGSTIGITYHHSHFDINYPILMLLPGSLYSVGLAVLPAFQAPDLLLIEIQIGYLSVLLGLAVVAFRRVQIWG